MTQPEYSPVPQDHPQQGSVPSHAEQAPTFHSNPQPQGHPHQIPTMPPQLPYQQSAPVFFKAPEAPKASKKLLWIGLGAGFVAGVLAVVIAAGISAAVEASSVTSFQTAADTCSSEHKAGITLGDEGSSITIDTKGEDDTSGAAFDDASCILTELEVPDYVISQMDDTSAMDGRQSASWEGVSASWTYHPDSGMKLILTVADKK